MPPEIRAELARLRALMVPDAEAYRRREIGSKRMEEEAKKIQPLRPLSAADTDLEYLSAASGGQVDMDRMRLELMNGGGKAKFLKDSKVKERLYHGTIADIDKFKMPKNSVGIWASRSPDVANEYATIAARGSGNPSIYPLHAHLKNPASEKEFGDAWEEAAKDSSRLGWNTHDQRHREILQSKGFDGAILGDSVVVFNPKQLKSAIGNRETYNTKDPDITKANGGSINKAKFLKDSKVKDVLYHGTSNDITQFDTNRGKGLMLGAGAYFTPNVKKAESYAGDTKGHNATIMPVHVSLKNPVETSIFDQKYMGSISDKENAKLRAKGHDGIILRNSDGNIAEVVVFHPHQIKSATGNRGTYDTNNPDITKKNGGLAHMNKGGSTNEKYPSIQEMIQRLKEEGRTPIVPVPNRWFADPVKHPHQQKMIERILAKTGHGREGFPSGAYINPQTGEPMDFDIMNDLGVVIDPNTGRPMMSGIKSDLRQIDPKYGSITKSNLVRKGLFKHEGGDELLKNLAFLATIEKSGKGHHYGLSTQYASPAELVNTMTGQNPTLRPHSRGDIFGVGDEVGRISIQGKHHPVYEKLLVAPAGSDVQGKKLHKAKGGKVTHAHHLEIEERPL